MMLEMDPQYWAKLETWRTRVTSMTPGSEQIIRVTR